MYPDPNVPRHGKSLYNPQESLENTIDAMGTLLGVHPIVPLIFMESGMKGLLLGEFFGRLELVSLSWWELGTFQVNSPDDE